MSRDGSQADLEPSLHCKSLEIAGCTVYFLEREDEQMKRKHTNAISNWPRQDRPRERLLKHGEHVLSNSELLAIILRTGSKGQSALDLAQLILKKFKTLRNMSHTDTAVWKYLKGMGSAKICQVKAAIELGRRLQEEEVLRKQPQIKSPLDAVRIFRPRMRDLKKEVFKIALLNPQNRIIEVIEAEEGTVNQAYPIIREIFQKALQYYASSIICCHNHPSGDCRPSPEDKKFTEELICAGKTLSLTCLDHIIIGDNDYFSFSNEGLT